MGVKAKTYGLTHLSMRVKDLDRTLRFYGEVFDMQLMYRDESFIQLNTPGTFDAIVFVKDTGYEMNTVGGINHFGFRLKDPREFDAVVEKVINAGGIIIELGEFAPGFPKLFFRDLDGYEIEVWYE